jgi:hypothetical protein
MSKVASKYNRAEVIKEEDRWKAESDARTLREAMEIRKDKKRMKKAKQIISEQLSALTEADKL